MSAQIIRLDRLANDLVTAVMLVMDHPYTAGLSREDLAAELNNRCDLVAERLEVPASLVRAQVTKAIALRAVMSGDLPVARAFLRLRAGSEGSREALRDIQRVVAKCGQ